MIWPTKKQYNLAALVCFGICVLITLVLFSMAFMASSSPPAPVAVILIFVFAYLVIFTNFFIIIVIWNILMAIFKSFNSDT